MKIDHIAMYVNELEKVAEFFEKYFGAIRNQMYQNPKTGFCSYFLSFEDGARLEIMTRPNMTNIPKTSVNMGLVHLAFSVGSKEKVNELTCRLKNDGWNVVSGPRITGDGYYESCVCVIENNYIEITE